MLTTATIRIDHLELDYDSLIGYQPEFDTQHAQDIIVDLSCVERITTAALAQLVLLRAVFAKTGRTFKIVGLKGQPKSLCTLLKLTCLSKSP